MGVFLPDSGDIKLVDLLGVEELSMMESMVAQMGRMAALITDEDGVPITSGSNFSRFCTDFCRTSPEGLKRCKNCDKMGAIMALERKRPVYYYCHANLVDFAAPIMLNDRMIGSFIGGQVLAQAPNEEKMRQTARELGVDEDEFFKAALETNTIPIHAIERCTQFIYDFAQMVSAMAYRAYVARRESELALQAASAKTDFLANMSHEIRTPMNAILGMSQIALRENMSPKARDYIDQVHNSAEMLLTIINDILDYSKLDAGKMSIIATDYSPLSLLKEVTGIIASRVGNKELEFVIDFDPSMPCQLVGDDVRIKQIIVNLANNAVKFTERGKVLLSLRYRRVDAENLVLLGEVTDTGLGIKEKDLGRLFNSFEQVDSKRNRKVEGTGLGLAIVKELLEAMEGTVEVESVYEQGSTFRFEIPQRISNPVRCIEPLTDCPVVLGIVDNPYIGEQLERDLNALGAQYIAISEEEVYAAIDATPVDYIFVQEHLVTERLVKAEESYPDMKLVIISPINHKKFHNSEQQIILHKPLSVMGISNVLHHTSSSVQVTQKEEELDFTAPEAKILIVDDNEVNLSVAVGLLEPLAMQVDTADSGIKSVEMAGEKEYDIVFMDHMMPEMDGIEAAHRIRELYPAYSDIPIVALTANTSSVDKALYDKEGLDDYVAKPIELEKLVTVLRRWLPQTKIREMKPEELAQGKALEDKTEESISAIQFLDTTYAMSLLKSEKLYWKVLKDYYNVIDKKMKKIKECEVQEEIGTYIVEVHALKSASRQIGALSLSKKAENLESAGNRHDIPMIHKLTDEMLEEYRNLQTSLSPFFFQEEPEFMSEGEKLDEKTAKPLFQEIRDALDELDFDKVEEKIQELAGYQFDAQGRERLKRLRDASDEMDIDTCMEIVDDWEEKIYE